MADSTDEDAVRFAQSQQIGILESESESLGGGNESIQEMRVWKLRRVKLLMSLGQQQNRVLLVEQSMRYVLLWSRLLTIGWSLRKREEKSVGG